MRRIVNDLFCMNVAGEPDLRLKPLEPAFWWALGTYFFLALAYVLPAFLPGRMIFGTDYLAMGYPVHEFASERFAAGALPKWIPYVFGGVPMFANPGSVFHPVRLAADLVFPVSKLYPVLYLVHLTAAGAGAYLLVRELGVRRWIAAVTGLVAEFTGLTTSFIYAGHDGRLMVACLFPLALFFGIRLLRHGTLGSAVGLSGTLGGALLSFQIQSNYYVLLVGALLALFLGGRLVRHGRGRALARRLVLGVAAIALAFAMAGVNFVPFRDYVAQSPRGGEGGRGYEYATSWSMPPVETVGLAVPEEAGILDHYEGDNPFKLHTEYVGALVLLLVALGAFYCRGDPWWWFFTGVAGLGLLISWGGYTPIYRLFYEFLPGTERFRAPSIALFTVSFSVVTMGAQGFEAVARERDREDGRIGPARWILAGAVGTTFLALLLRSGADGHAVQGYLRFAAFAAATGLLLWLWLEGKASAPLAAACLALLATVDLWVVDRQFFETTGPPDRVYAADEVVRFLQTQEGPFRVWVPPLGGRAGYNARADYFMLFDLERSGGEHGNQLQRYNEFVGAGERTYVDWHNFLQDPRFWNLGNVRYLVTGAPLDVPGLREAHRTPGALIYENPAVLPRAYLVSRVRVASGDRGLSIMQSPDFEPGREAVVADSLEGPLPGGDGSAGDARVVEYEPDRVVVSVRAERDALLVLSDNYYEGWEVTVDGGSAAVHRTNHTFRGVRVPEGEHRVVFEFQPAALYAGLGLSSGAVLIWFVGLWLGLRRAGRSRAPARVGADGRAGEHP